MKQVFNSKEVAHIWAQQSQESGKNSGGNFYFEGATIYSYGKHFPIATIEGNDILFTLRGYSNTTAKHLIKTRRAISHKNVIDCFEVPIKYYGNKKPLNKQSFTFEHDKNISAWKAIIVKIFAELGNPKNRNKAGRISEINQNIEQLNRYCKYFKLPIKDKELNKLIALSKTDSFISAALEAGKVDIEKYNKKIKSAAKAYEISIDLWRKYDNEGLQALPDKTKELARFYQNQKESFTRLRYNKTENRLETSKGVEIPAAIAKRAYITLNGCMDGVCDSLAIPVMGYTITKTTDKAIIAGCHTIPKEDVRYIATLLNWK